MDHLADGQADSEREDDDRRGCEQPQADDESGSLWSLGLQDVEGSGEPLRGLFGDAGDIRGDFGLADVFQDFY